MKIEGTIKQLESILDHVCSMAASPDADNIWRKDIDALEFSIVALRSMPEAGEPLSLEQLKQMDGESVWVEDKCDPELSAWGNVCGDACVVFHKQKYYGAYHIEDYEERWLAYSYPLAHIDRNEWKP